MKRDNELRNKNTAKQRAYVCVRLPLWAMKGNNRAEREAPTTLLIQTPLGKLKSWRSVKDGRSHSLQCKGTAVVLKNDIMRSFHVCTFFLATIMTNLSNICTIRRRAGHSWVGCKANLRGEKLKKQISQSLPQVGQTLDVSPPRQEKLQQSASNS